MGKRKSPLHPSAERALELATAWRAEPGERRMALALLDWLIQMRWLGTSTRVAFEVPWRGRRIDLVTASGRGRLTTFELKLGGAQRALEQAVYNSVAAHRSFVVLAAEPLAVNRDLAGALGLGLIVVNGSAELRQRPSNGRRTDELLATALRQRVAALTT